MSVENPDLYARYRKMTTGQRNKELESFRPKQAFEQFKQSIPNDLVAKDFHQVRKLQSIRSGILSSGSSQNRRLTERLLDRKLMKRFIQEMTKPNNDQSAEMSNG